VAPPEVLSFAAGATLSNQDTIAFALIFNQGVSGLVVGDFSQSENPCSTAALTGSEANYTITLAGCPNGNHSLILASNSVTGAAAGPAQSVSSNSILLDLVAPQATWSTTSSTSFDSPIFEINFDESVSGLVVADFNQPSASQCTLALIELTAGTKYLIETTSCGYGQVQLSLSAGSVTDAAMNPGLASQSASVVYAQQPVATPTPTAEPTQTPTPTAEPTQAPIAEALPVIPSTPEPPSASDSMAPVEAAPIEPAPIEPAPVEAAPIEPAPITTQTPEVIETLLPFDEATIDASIAESSFATAPLSASIDLPITETPAKALPQEIQSVPLQVMQAVSQESTKPDLIGWAYLAVGIVGAAAVSVGAASVASTFRSRRRLLTS
jgi:cell pole-organizing protein PopZ